MGRSIQIQLNNFYLFYCRSWWHQYIQHNSIQMFNQSVLDPGQLPYPDKSRKSTDVCCTWIGAIFALTMFILACIFFNRTNLNNSVFLDVGNNDPNCTAYFDYTASQDSTSYLCAAACPANSTIINQNCLPTDPALQKPFLDDPSITAEWDYNGFKTTLFWTAIVALGFGLLWMTFVHCAPRIAPYVAAILAIIALFAIGLITILTNSGFIGANPFLKILVAVICFLLVIIFIAMLCYYNVEMKFQGLLLDYAKRFLNESPLTFLYIPVFLLFTLGFFALITFQHFAFASKSWSGVTPFDFSGAGFWSILNIIEFIWGFQFLRDAFNFCVSGNAVDWYWTRQTPCYSSYRRLVTRNWGSVVGGSFLNAFFQIPTLIAELLICHPNTCCSKCGTFCYNGCSCFGSLFNLVRTDAYSYINLTGIPFCNSARECEKLCSHASEFVGTHSAIKHYRFVAHCLLVALTFIIGILILRVRVINHNLWHFIILIVVIIAVVTYFIGIHADAAEGIQTSFLAEHYSSEGYQYMQKCIPSYRRQFQGIARRTQQTADGNC